MEKFITAALQPAEHLKIKLNAKKKEANITVPEDQLSLAIGRDGQNVRLAAKITGYKINLNDDKPKKVKAKTAKKSYKKD